MRGFNTRAIHAGQEPDAATGAVNVPVHLSTTFKQDGVGGLRGGYEYSRSGNPTRTALQEALAALEQGTHGMAFASGLAAEDTLLRTVCEPGDHVILGGDAYGGTFRLISQVLSRWGVEHTPADLDDPDAVRAAIRPTTRVIWCETPTNPLLNIADIARTAEVAHEAGALLVVDNTFASPYLQQPLTLGADVVVHSTTKYLGGHSDVVGGALVTADAELGEQLAYNQNAMGAVAGAVRLLAGAARYQDPRRAHGPAPGRTRRGSPSSCSATPTSPRCSTRGCPTTPGTTSRRSRCRASAGCCRSACAAARSRRCASASGRSCSRWPSRWAASSR